MRFATFGRSLDVLRTMFTTQPIPTWMADFASVADVINRYSIVHRTSCFEQLEAKRINIFPLYIQNTSAYLTSITIWRKKKKDTSRYPSHKIL